MLDGVLRLSFAGPGLGTEAFALRPGQEVTAGQGEGAYRIAFVGAAAIPALQVADMPGAQDGRATVQMSTDREGRSFLVITGIDADPVALPAGVPLTTAAGYVYTFGGRVEASGVNVRRDPGDTFIWVAVGMAIVGLSITFYVPRRRVWVKVTPGRTYFAGIAEKSTRLGRELRQMGTTIGSRDAIRPEDLPGDR
jgi:cytochrome c biogenesis protein ResB